MSNKGPFEKLRVLDLARTLAGSYAATILANLGAEVITIEQPGRMSKSAGLPGRLAGGVNAAYNNFVYNKKCIAMDMRKERGKDIFYRLVEKTDILVENYRPEVSRALGLDYETLHKINPRIISCSITGYGSEGPYSNLLAWDAAGQAVSGIMSLTGEHNGGPCVVGAPIIDVGTGMNAALGIMAALYYRDRVGEGQRVEVSLIETGLGFLSWFPTYYSAGGKFPNPEGSSFPLLPLNGAFRTKSGYLHLACLHQGHWEKLCQMLERPDLFNRPEFIDENARMKNKFELRNIIQGILLTRTAEDWLKFLGEAGIPVAPVNNMQSLLTDAQVQQLNLLVDMISVEGKPIKIVRLPFRMSKFPDVRYRPISKVGEHTEEVLRELAKITPQEMEALRQEKVIDI